MFFVSLGFFGFFNYYQTCVSVLHGFDCILYKEQYSDNFNTTEVCKILSCILISRQNLVPVESREERRNVWNSQDGHNLVIKHLSSRQEHRLGFVSGTYGLDPKSVSHNSTQMCSRYCYKAEWSINGLLKHQSFAFRTAY